METKYLMSITEASKHFNIGRDKLYSLARSDKSLPILKIGAFIKINVPLFEVWLNNATIEGKEL